MAKTHKVSVAIAIFNGGEYLNEQLDSILVQLDKCDEIIASIDASSDDSLEILQEYAKKDNRVKVIEGANAGAIKNFEKAILNCTGDYIFLSDQDDIWLAGKVSKVKDCLKNEDIDLVLHDAKVADENLKVTCESFFRLKGSKPGILRNILKNSYMGCCMAFKGSLKGEILPFPSDIPMHDQWIGLIAEKYGKVKFLDEALVIYRRHRGNISSLERADFRTMLRWRYNIIKGLMKSR
ncbi:MAG: glycosyltransferase family 2 protein [Clostridia bacterium]|nr:glycosyltransferase family 2 protein [Clostridia bacterium]